MKSFRVCTVSINRVTSLLGTRSFSGHGGPAKPLCDQVDKDGFRIYKIPGLHKSETKQLEKKPFLERRDLTPREKKMNVDQDWTEVWPTAATFNPSVVPLPIRQGYVDNTSENQGIIPYKYHNTELLKIPNFLHLTPKHIEKHCAAIKKFCSPWPKGLETDEACDKHFPISITTKDYVLDGPSLRDPRARTVVFELSMKDLQLDEHAEDKLIRLLGDKYDKDSGKITLKTDVCPLRKQNTDFAFYLLTALYFESWKTEPWEADMTFADLRSYDWSKSEAAKKLNNLVEKLPHLSDSKQKEKKMETYGEAVEALHNEGENEKTMSEYKSAVLNLLRATG